MAPYAIYDWSGKLTGVADDIFDGRIFNGISEEVGPRTSQALRNQLRLMKSLKDLIDSGKPIFGFLDQQREETIFPIEIPQNLKIERPEHFNRKNYSGEPGDLEDIYNLEHPKREKETLIMLKKQEY